MTEKNYAETRRPQTAGGFWRSAKHVYHLLSLPCLLSALAGRPATAAPRFSGFLEPSSGKLSASDIRPAARRRLVDRSLPATGSLPIVRAGYIVPSNRSPQPNASGNFQSIIRDAQTYYRDQLDLHGFGPKTFRYETDTDGISPLIHVVSVAETDAELRSDIWGNTINAAINAGLSIWAPGEIWLLIPEAHVQNADGSITGGTALGASFGSGADPGVAMVGSDILVRFKSAFLTDDRSYAGLTIAELGSLPLVQDVSFPWFEGTTVSSIASSARGALFHEFGHALGLPHDFRNDNNFRGNVMGNGLRGARGVFYPGRYPADYAWLSYSAAIVLKGSRYFNNASLDTSQPIVSVQTSGSVTPVNGLIHLDFSATDDTSLASVFLALNGDWVADMTASGPSFSGSFAVPNYQTGVNNSFTVVAFDTSGNRGEAQTVVVPGVGNRAPLPSLNVSPVCAFPGETVAVDAFSSNDPDGNNPLTYEWDLDGDLIFETSTGFTATTSILCTLPENRLVRVRVTDSSGAQSISTALVMQCHLPGQIVSPSGAIGVQLDWASRLGIGYQVESAAAIGVWTASALPRIEGDGGPRSYLDSTGALSSKKFYHLVLDRLRGP
jgi:hypothetical protein